MLILQARLTPYHLNKMHFDDGQLSKDRVTNIARELDGDLILCEAVCQKHEDRIYIATQIKDRGNIKNNTEFNRLE